MIFSYNWLQSYFKEKLPRPERVAELLTMHSFEVESLEKKRRDYLLNIDVLPNRAHDCLCHWGIAREISVLLGKKLPPLKKEKLKEKKGRIEKIDLKINTPKLVPRYSAIVIEGIEVKKSPKWLKERVESVGIRSINNIVDLTNYVMLEIGQPLHAFDYDKIINQRMIIREAKKGEKVITLDDIERDLDKGMLVIEDKNRLIDLVGIMGGKLSEIDNNTKNIVLQAGNFDRMTIYKTTRKLKHRTEASDIYIQGIDPNLTISALERFYFLLKKIYGKKVKIVQIIDIYPKKVLPKRVILNFNYVKKYLGVEISKKEIEKILQGLGFKIKKVINTQSIEIEIPTHRLDVSLPEDLIEEIGRIYGYEKIPPLSPLVPLIPPERNSEIFWEGCIKNIFKELGFSELYNYSFISPKDAEIFGYRDSEIIEVENPVTVEQKILRPNLIPNLLKKARDNFKYLSVGASSSKQKNREDDEIKIFELGKVFKKEKGKILEKKELAGVLAIKTYRNKDSQGFYELKGALELALNKVGISDVWYDDYRATPEESKPKIWQPNRCAEIKVHQQEIGFLGEISSEILNSLEIEGEVVAFEIDFEKLKKLCSEECEYQPICQYPAAVRDLAVLVPLEVKVVDVLNKINASGGPLVRDVDLFDIYEGEELPEGKKNLAFHIIYQAEDRTLSAEEIDKIHQKIIESLEKDPEWEVRK